MLQFSIMTVVSIAVGIIAIAHVSPEAIRAVVPEGWRSLWFGWTVDMKWTSAFEMIQVKMAEEEMNVYDIRLTRHEDGWIYGTFCAERHDPAQPDNPSAALARAGIARTRDLKTWERLPDLKTPSAQQRNYVLHPEFVDGKYAFYTRPMHEFKAAGCTPTPVSTIPR